MSSVQLIAKFSSDVFISISDSRINSETVDLFVITSMFNSLILKLKTAIDLYVQQR